MSFRILLSSLVVALGLAINAQAAYVLSQIGSGTASWTAAEGTNKTVAVTAASFNRSTAGFGQTDGTFASVQEGIYYTYTFSLTSAAFDVQNSFGGMWSGWGSQGNGTSQRGPTTANWGRNRRYQHDYADGTSTATDTPALVVPGLTPTLNTTLSKPANGDTLRVEMYYNGITNTFDYIFTNLTKNESFLFTYTDTAAPTGNLVSINSLVFRSDSGIRDFAYTYGTFAVVPEPSRFLLLMGGLGFLCFRRRR